MNAGFLRLATRRGPGWRGWQLSANSELLMGSQSRLLYRERDAGVGYSISRESVKREQARALLVALAEGQ